MSRFRKLIENEGFNFNDTRNSPPREKTFEAKFYDILNAAFKDILEEKSKIYRSMIDKGIGIDFSTSFTFPEQTKADIHELIDFYKEDMK